MYLSFRMWKYLYGVTNIRLKPLFSMAEFSAERTVQVRAWEPELEPDGAGCFLVQGAEADWEKKLAAGAAAKKQEPEPQKNMPFLYRLIEDKKHCKFVSLLLVKFLWLNTIIWLVLCFLKFYINSLWGKKYFSKLDK